MNTKEKSLVAICGAALILASKPASACNSAAPCETQTNSGSGQGLEGEAQGSSEGLYGVNTNLSGSGIGVKGFDDSVSSGGAGVWGVSLKGYGVYATSSDNSAVYAESTSSTSGAGVEAYAASASPAVDAQNSSSGPGVYAVSSSGYGVQAYGGSSTAAVYADGGSYGVLGYGTIYALYGSATGTNSSGVLGICSGSGCSAVYASGDLDYTGSLNHVSDERLKRDIAPLKDSLKTLDQLKPVSFYWKDPTQHGNTATIQRGFIAQDYEKVFPEWVKTDKDGYKMIDTTGLDALEVEGIQQLRAENDALKKRLDTLESSRKVVVAGNAWGFAFGGLALGLGLVVTQRKKKDA